MHFFPQMADVHHDGIVSVQVAIAPHRLVQFLRADRPAPVLTQVPQDGKFQGRQLQFFAVQCAAVIPPVDP